MRIRTEHVLDTIPANVCIAMKSLDDTDGLRSGRHERFTPSREDLVSIDQRFGIVDISGVCRVELQDPHRTP